MSNNQTNQEDIIIKSPIPVSISNLDPNMPSDLKTQIKELDSWALENLKESRRDTIKFWLLKIPAILASASAGISAYYGWDVIALVLGAVGSICVLIDGIYPSGMLRNVHVRAYYDIKSLEQTMIADWRIGRLNNKGKSDSYNELAVKILKGSQDRIKEITTFIKDAEAALDIRK